MTLPVLNRPEFKDKYPSTDQEFKYYPMTIAQEKILMIAKESDDTNDILDAIVQIVEQCTCKTCVARTMPLCDIEWAYLKIRSSSVSNIAKMSFNEDGVEKPHEFEIDLNKVKIEKTKKHNDLITVTKDVSLKMKLTPMSLYLSDDYRKTEKVADQFDMIMLASIDQIISGDEVMLAANEDQKELKEWLSTIPSKAYEDIEQFFSDAPKLHHELSYKDKNGVEQKIVLSTLNDFFTF